MLVTVKTQKGGQKMMIENFRTTKVAARPFEMMHRHGFAVDHCPIGFKGEKRARKPHL